MRSFLFLSIVSLSVACEETDKESDGTDLVGDTGSPGSILTDTAEEDTANTDQCGVIVVSSMPEADNRDFFYRDAIRVSLSDPDDTATISVRKLSGTSGDVEGRTEVLDEELIFIPAAALEPSSEYMIYVSTCSAETVEEIAFATSDFGLPIDAQMLGNTYAFNFGSGSLQPEELQASLDGMVENYIMLSVFDQTGSRLQFHSGSSVPGEYVQDYCAATGPISEPVDFSQSPHLEVAFPMLPFRSNDQTLNLRDFTLSFTLSPDGKRLAHGSWTAEADMREFAPLLNQVAYDMCNNYLPTFDVHCGPCRDGQSYCIPLSMANIEAEDGDKEINCVDDDQCHVECANNAPGCEPKVDECEQ